MGAKGSSSVIVDPSFPCARLASATLAERLFQEGLARHAQLDPLVILLHEPCHDAFEARRVRIVPCRAEGDAGEDVEDGALDFEARVDRAETLRAGDECFVCAAHDGLRVAHAQCLPQGRLSVLSIVAAHALTVIGLAPSRAWPGWLSAGAVWFFREKPAFGSASGRCG